MSHICHGLECLINAIPVLSTSGLAIKVIVLHFSLLFCTEVSEVDVLDGRRQRRQKQATSSAISALSISGLAMNIIF